MAAEVTEMSERESVQIYFSDKDQQVAFEDALEQIENDVDDGLIDAETWGGSVKRGEALRVVCEAYTGRLEFNGGATNA